MKWYLLFTLSLLSTLCFSQYQGIPMTGSNIKPNQIRWTRSIGTDSIFIMASDTITGKPFWYATKKISSSNDSCYTPYVVDIGGNAVSLSCSPDGNLPEDITIYGGTGVGITYNSNKDFTIENTGGTNTDNQTLSLLSGGGTLKLTQFGLASNFVQLRDSSITNEGKLTLTPPSGGIAYINSNTSTSASIGINAGSGITLSNGGTNIVTITNSGLNTDNQTLSLLASGGTLKLTKTGSASDFVQLRDSSISNEGVLSVGVGTATTSLIKSNSSTSPDITIEAGSGVTLAESGNKITISNSGLTSIKEAKKTDRLGIIVVSDSVGFDYKKLVKEDYPDSLMMIPVFDSLHNTNKKIDLSYLDYDPYGQTTQISDFNLSLVAGVDSTIRLEEGLGYLFNYSYATGELTYVGSKTLIFKIDVGIDVTMGLVTPDEITFSLYHNQYGTYNVIAESYARNGYSKATNLASMKMITSKLVQVNPQDKFKIGIKTDVNNTATIRAGFMNIVMVSRHIGF